ncbi:MAG: PAS domain-containing protein [Methylococcales bacterium]
MDTKLSHSVENYEKELSLYKCIVSVSEGHMSFSGPDYIYQVVNDAYLNAHNKKREEIINHSIAELLGEDVFRNIIKKNIDRCFNGETIKYEDWFDFSGIGRRLMDVTYYPHISEKTAKVIGVVVVSRDITKNKQHIEHLKIAAIELRESQKSLRKAQKMPA